MKTFCRCVLQDTRLRILRLPGTRKMRRSEPAAFCEECNENGGENYRKILQENSQDETFRACSIVKNVVKMVERIIEKYYKRTGKMRRSEPAAALCEECYDDGEE